jgi:hypothetical protein
MVSLLVVLVLSTAAPPLAGARAPWMLPRPPDTGVLLRYDPPLGQVAEYRVTLDVRGEQTSLGESLPVRWRGGLEVTEEVIAKGVDGTLWLRVRTDIVEARDATGTLAGAMPAQYPAVHVRMSPLGEVIDVSVATGERASGPRERAFLSLAAQPGLAVLPAGRVEAGDEWRADTGGGRQISQLLSLSESGSGTVALISSRRAGDLELSEGSSALGLQTSLSGRMTQESELRLLVDQGLVLAHKGQTEMHTDSVASLDLPDGAEQFDIQADLTVDFDVQLVAVDGQPVGPS